jgi:hypothetical protein
MKRLLRLAARLYPRAWRNRYREEFDALIEDMTPRWRHVVNIVVGALIMQLSRPALIPVALAVAGAVAGVAVSLAMPPVYASSSWVLVQAPGTADDAGDRGQRIRTAIDAALQETAFDRKAIAVTVRGEPGRDPVLLEVSASAGSARAAQQAAVHALGSLIEANVVASQRLTENPLVQFRALQPPELPRAARRDITTTSAVGGGLGLLAGALVSLVAHRRRRTTA